jgi:hypothetical protein
VVTVDPWFARLAAVLGELAPRVGRLAAEVERGWPDHSGRAWGARAGLVHRELARVAAEAAELAARCGDGGWVPGRSRALRPAAASEPRGPRLPGTEGQRADDGTGVRIAELPPP